jgi:tetraacyldisaccharide 4'-kinase
MRLLRWFLAPLTPLYGGIARLRNRAFDRHPERSAALPVPVLSVGNLSTGGTGKTPLTLHLAEALATAGWRTGVLSRGYGGRRRVDPMTVALDSNPAETGDEPLLMARRLGPERVVVGRSRHAAGLRALSLQPPPELLLLDDGFQHRGLRRDLDLLVLDGVRRWGNGHTLPLGDLREPMAGAARADALVVTRGSRADQTAILAWWQRYGFGGPVFWVDFALGALRRLDTGERLALPGPVPGPLFAFCALGHPEAFFADLLVAGLPWVGTRAYRDHQALGPADLARLQALAGAEEAVGLVCTEKDAVKLGPWAAAGPLPVWVAEQRVLGAEPLVAWIRHRLGQPPSRGWTESGGSTPGIFPASPL